MVPLIRLQVHEAQKAVVAGNAVTLAQVAYETGATAWGLWLGAEPVGLMAMIDPRAHPWPRPGDDPGAAYLWRLMIDVRHQGRGHGRAAIQEALAVARGWGLPRLALSTEPGPASPVPFYETLGFRRVGEVPGKVVLSREVHPGA